MGWLSIRAFLATILSPFRSTFPMDVPWLFHSSPLVMTFSVALWREALRRDPLYLQCMVERIVFCKCDARKQHEFLVIIFRHHALNHSAPVVVDRAVLQESQDASSVKQAQQCSTVKSPTLSTTSAADFVHLIGNNCHLKPYLTRTFGKYAELCVINFPADVDRPSVMQVATLLSVVHQQAPQYDVYQNQCHWFACTAWDALVTLFPGQHGACKSHVTRSRYHGFPIGMAGSVAAVLDKYASEWETTITEVRTHRTIRVAEEEQLRASAREEGRAEGEAELEQMKAEFAKEKQLHAEGEAEWEQVKAELAKEKQLRAEVHAEIEALRHVKAEYDLLRAQLTAAERRVHAA